MTGLLGIGAVRRIAIIGGVLLPVFETIRRSAGLAAWWLWIDDYLIGAALLAGAWASRNRSPAGLRGLAASWGVASGMGYYSFAGHVLRIGERDVSGVSGLTTATIVGLLWLIALYALASAIAAGE